MAFYRLKLLLLVNMRLLVCLYELCGDWIGGLGHTFIDY